MHSPSDNKPHRGSFTATINGKVIDFADPAPSVRQLLNAVDYVPADDCILIQGLPHGTRAVGLDETVDLREGKDGKDIFWAFKSDRVYRFTVDERGFDWGGATIKEPLLRAIAHVKEDELLVLERRDKPDQDLNVESVVDFAEPGTEHLRVESRLVEVFFKDKPYKINRGVYTTEQLMALFPIEKGYLLNLKTHDGELVTLKPEEKVSVKCGMHFYSQVNGGGSS